MKLNEFKDFELDKTQLNALITGGMSKEDYCDLIQFQANTSNGRWTQEEWDAWSYAYETHCMN